MQTLKLAIEDRQETGRQASRIRSADRIPGVIYGHDTENRNISVDYNAFAKAHKHGGESTLIELESKDGQTVKALIKDTQRDPLSDRYTHVDFYKVNLKEKVVAEIPLVFSGESAAVKALGGFLVTPKDAVEVESLPGNLPHDIKVDISALKTFDDAILASDLPMPEGVALTIAQDATIAFVQRPKTEAEIAAEEEEARGGDVSEIKTEAEEKKDSVSTKTEEASEKKS